MVVRRRIGGVGGVDYGRVPGGRAAVPRVSGAAQLAHHSALLARPLQRPVRRTALRTRLHTVPGQ